MTIGAEPDVELTTQGVLHVDFGEHSEALCLERVNDPGLGLRECATREHTHVGIARHWRFHTVSVLQPMCQDREAQWAQHH